MGTPRVHAVPEALEAEEPEQSRFCPAGVGANLFAKGPVHSPKMHFLNDRLREQVRSHGLRPESKADLCVTMGTPRVHAVPEALEAEEPEQARFCPAGVGANLFAKGPVHSPKMHFLNDRLREQVRSHGLRPESKADLCVTMGTPRVHAVPEAPEAEEPEQSRFCPAGVGANLFAKGPVYSPKMHFLNDRLREQVRSHGLRPESKADLCVTMGTPRGHAVPEALEAEEPEQSRFCPAGVGANLFAKGSVYSPKMHFLNDRLREQVRSHGLRPESKADLCVTMGTPRVHAVPEALEAEEPEQSRFCPAGVGANLFAKGPVHSPKMHFLNDRLREQVRSHGLRPESKADLC
ncbi:hypothetical protein [Pseudomonas syringae]|uniref:hypothetical protein n=1 Tax=Pseudomonas syringae TaxID=317 RepID=UPI001910BA70|nr:hypothetical protein [Pseudomonas syringae]